MGSVRTSGLFQRLRAAEQFLRWKADAWAVRREARRHGLVYAEGPVAAAVRARLAARGLVPPRKARGSIKVLWVGAYEPQDRSGTIQGLEVFGRVSTFNADASGWGPKRYDWKANHEALMAMVDRGGVPDVVIGNMYGADIHADSLVELGRRGVVIVNIAMDDRHTFNGRRLDDGRWSGPAGLLPGIDLACTTTRESCTRYLARDTPALWLPMASDSEVFRSRNPVPKDIDVSFVGVRYGVRERVVAALRRSGLGVKAYGPGWEEGFLPNDRIPEVIARSRICLGVSAVGHTWSITAPKLRDYDMTMAGACYLTQHTPDIVEQFVPGVEIDTYRDLEECVRKARYYVAHPEAAEAMGAAARRRCLRDHQWTQRFEKVFSVAGVLAVNDDCGGG